jgi:phosphoserine phosphatase RsbU/P
MDEMLIAEIPLFATLPSEEVRHLTKVLRPLTIPPKTLLLREGYSGNRFYIILDGWLEIIKALDSPDERQLGMRGPGDCVGEMSLFDPTHCRTASVRSHTSVKVVEMTHAEFNELLHRYPAIAYEMARMLSVCLRESNDATIRDLQEKNRMLAEAYQQIQAAQQQIVEKEKLEHELQMAREIQQSILPSSIPFFPGYEFGFRIVPARAVGGDFFDFIQLDGDRLGIAIGDVSDKGMPAAIFMAMTRSLMRAEARRAETPADALYSVNRHLIEMNEAGMFVTVLYGVLNRESGKFSFARAGHELPVLCAPCGMAIKTPIGQGQPLGLFPEPSIDEQTVEISPGGTLLIYTDGITEAPNLMGDPFGLKRLFDMVCKHRTYSAQEMCDRLIQEVVGFQCSAPQHDDITLVAIRADYEGRR